MGIVDRLRVMRSSQLKGIRWILLVAICLLGGLGVPARNVDASSLPEGKVTYFRNDDIVAFKIAAKQILEITTPEAISNFDLSSAATEITTRDGGPRMPTAGRGDLVDEWLSAGALIACVAIAVGLVIISRRRRKGGDGL